jgi:hypothetical protein
LPRYYDINKDHGATTQASIHYGKYSYIHSINDVQSIYSRFVMHETKVHYIIMGILTRLISMTFYSQNVDHLDLLYATHKSLNKHEIFNSKN